MNRDDIWRMAKQAGGREARNPELYDCFIMSLDDLERLYHHAAAAEREACAKVCDLMEQQAEGTECCKWPTPIDCAAAIRARSNP